ncbi:MAG: CHAT domain-containing protein [Myxococcales bacterium]|nr:CHAT domain-containing protein [Myxococcales bacterium]
MKRRPASAVGPRLPGGLLLLAAACGGGSGSAAPLAAQLGCELELDRSELACVGEATVFVASERAPTATLNGEPLTLAWRAVEGGWRAEVDAEGRLELEAGGARGAWSLRARDDRFDEVEARRSAGDLEGALEALETLERQAPSDDTLGRFPKPPRARVAGLRARIALRAGRVDEAVAGLRVARVAAERAGLPTRAALDAIAEAFTERARWRFAEARAALDAASRLGAPDAQMDTRVAYHRGLVARDVGDVREALRAFERAQASAARVGPDDVGAWAAQAAARLRHELGRRAEAYAELDAVRAEGACERAHLATNRGWLSLLDAEERVGVVDRAALELAARLYASECPHPAGANARVNLALASWLEGDLVGARGALEGAADAANLEVALWRDVIESRLAASSGEARAAAARLEGWLPRLAAAPPGARWRVWVELAKVRVDEGASEAAIGALRAAEDELEAESRRRPIEGNLGGFAGYRDESARRLVHLLVSEGALEEAFDVARRARTRRLRQLRWRERVAALDASVRARWEQAVGAYLAARADASADAAEDWRLSAEALETRRQARAGVEARLGRLLDDAYAVLASGRGIEAGVLGPGPAEGELTLLHFDELAFAAWTQDGARRVEVHRVDPEDPFGPFAARLSDARFVRLLPHGTWRAVPLHAEVLGPPVVYGLDLPRERAPRQRRGAVVVADPRGDLPFALAEGRALAAHLGAPLLAGDDASWDAVGAVLRTEAVFYYAGHGEAADDPLRSALPLAHGGRLEAGDVLALERVPSVVVLSGCETASASLEGAPATLGLAQAFVASGAERVIATTARVPDAAARRFADALRRHAATSDEPFSVGSVAAAIAELRAAGLSDVTSYRMLVP